MFALYHTPVIACHPRELRRATRRYDRRSVTMTKGIRPPGWRALCPGGGQSEAEFGLPAGPARRSDVASDVAGPVNQEVKNYFRYAARGTSAPNWRSDRCICWSPAEATLVAPRPARWISRLLASRWRVCVRRPWRVTAPCQRRRPARAGRQRSPEVASSRRESGRRCAAGRWQGTPRTCRLARRTRTGRYGSGRRTRP